MKIRFAMFVCLCACLTTPLWSSISTRTTIFEVVDNGNHEKGGIISFEFDGNDLPTASVANPVFIRISMPAGVTLSDTLVWSHPSNAGNDSVSPINLAVSFRQRELGSAVVAPVDAIAIARWKAGENAIWLRITVPTDQWIENNGNPIPPSANNRLRVVFGYSARFSWQENNGRFLSAETNARANTRSTVGDISESQAVSTNTCLNLTQVDFTTLNNLVTPRFSTSFFNDMAINGTTSPTEANDEGDIVLGTPLNPTFGGDDRIIRVFEGAVLQYITNPIDDMVMDPGTGLFAHPFNFNFTASNALLGIDFLSGTRMQFNLPPANQQGFAVAVDGSNNPVDYNTVDPSVPPGTRVLVEELAITSHAGFGQPSAPMSTLFQVEGKWLTYDASFTYGGPPLASPLAMTIDINFYLTAPVAANQNAFTIQTFPLAHDNPFDTAPFDGPDQWALCQPSTYDSLNNDWFFGNVVRATPTLGEWALIGFVTLLMGLAMWFNRKRRLMA